VQKLAAETIQGIGTLKSFIFFYLRMHQNAFGGRARGSLQRSTQPLAGLRGRKGKGATGRSEKGTEEMGNAPNV